MDFVECKVCNRKFKRINTFHLKTHNLTEYDYKMKYPNAKMFHDNYINNISKGTTIGMKPKSVRDKLKYKKSKEHCNKISNTVSSLHKSGYYDNNYTKERNKKISQKKKAWWVDKDSKKLMKKWMKDYIGSDRHREVTKMSQKLATKASLGIKQSKPEKEYEQYLVDNNIKYEKQYFVENYPYDFYLPDENKLIEIDGEFYHPLKKSECIYPVQKHNFERDKKKNKLAEKYGYMLERIRV